MNRVILFSVWIGTKIDKGTKREGEEKIQDKYYKRDSPPFMIEFIFDKILV